RGGGDAAVAKLFRGVHTMKGMGAAMGYTSVAELSHELETLLDKLRNGTIAVARPVVDTLFAGVDSLEQAVDLATAPTPQQLDVTRIIARIRQIATEEPSTSLTSEFPIAEQKSSLDAPAASSAPQRAPRHIRIDSKRLDTLMNVVGELVI